MSKSSKPTSLLVSGILGRFDAGSGSSRQSSSMATPKPKSTTIKSLTPSKKSFEKRNEERYQWLVDIRDAENVLLTTLIMIQEPYTFPNRHGPSLLLLKSNIGKSNQNVEHCCFPKGENFMNCMKMMLLLPIPNLI